MVNLDPLKFMNRQIIIHACTWSCSRCDFAAVVTQTEYLNECGGELERKIIFEGKIIHWFILRHRI